MNWAPKIPIDVQDHSYVKDIGAFEVDAVMLNGCIARELLAVSKATASLV